MNPQISIKIRCNNQITVTCGNYRKKIENPHQNIINLSDRIKPRQIDALKEDFSKVRERYEGNKDLYKWRLSPPLDIISKSQRDKKIPFSRLNKPKNFTRHSGQKVRESGAAMQIVCGADSRFCHEVTLTLPANHSSAFAAIAAYSGYAINRLTQVIRRDYGDSVLWFFVWEYQKRGALHLHMALYHPDETEGLWLCHRLCELWHKILVDIGSLADCDMFLSKDGDRATVRAFHQHHCQPIQKDVGRYFAKYAGKQESKNNWYVKKYPVSRFWGSCRALKAVARENSFECSWDYLSNIHEQEKKMTEIIESILAKINVVSASSYEFSVSLKGSARLNRYKNGMKILSVDSDVCVASGIRHTFYCCGESFAMALDFVKNMAGYF